MTLDEAQQLAHVVESSEDWIVTAVGRFVLLDELQKACEGGFDQKLPWMVAIMAVGDVKTLTKLTCFKDWDDLQQSAVIPKPVQDIPESIQKTRDSRQSIPDGMLF